MEGFDNSFVAVAGARNFAAVGAGSFAVVGVVVNAEVEGAEVVDAGVKDVVFADVAMFVVAVPVSLAACREFVLLGPATDSKIVLSRGICRWVSSGPPGEGG